jgi:hypothetical protein
MKCAVLAAFLSFLAVNAEEEDVKIGGPQHIERRDPQLSAWGRQQPTYTWGSVATPVMPWGATKQTQNPVLKGWPGQSWPKQPKAPIPGPNQMPSRPGGQYTGFGPGGLPLETRASRPPGYPASFTDPRFTQVSHITPQSSTGSYGVPSIPSWPPRPGTVQGSPAPKAPEILPFHTPAVPAQPAPKSASPTPTPTGPRTASSPGSRPPKVVAPIPLPSPTTGTVSPDPAVSSNPSPSTSSKALRPSYSVYPHTSVSTNPVSPVSGGLPSAWLGASILLPPRPRNSFPQSPTNLALTVSGTYWSMPRYGTYRPTPKPEPKWQPKPPAPAQSGLGGPETSEYEFKDGQWYRAGQALPLAGSPVTNHPGEYTTLANLLPDAQASETPPPAGPILGWWPSGVMEPVQPTTAPAAPPSPQVSQKASSAKHGSFPGGFNLFKYGPWRSAIGKSRGQVVQNKNANKGQLAKRDWPACTDITILYASGSNERSGRPVIESLDNVLGQHSISIRSLDFPADYSVSPNFCSISDRVTNRFQGSRSQECIWKPSAGLFD